MINKDPESNDGFDKRVKRSRREKWNQKKLHGVRPKTLDANSPHSNLWLQNSNLKPPTEALITAAQDQALRTRWFDANILKHLQMTLAENVGGFQKQ